MALAFSFELFVGFVLVLLPSLPSFVSWFCFSHFFFLFQAILNDVAVYDVEVILIVAIHGIWDFW
jgi:hypothetical protein